MKPISIEGFWYIKQHIIFSYLIFKHFIIFYHRNNNILQMKFQIQYAIKRKIKYILT